MALTWTNDNDGRRMLGFSVIVQPATAIAASADYATGGYTVLPATFGFQILRELTVVGTSSANSSTAFTTAYVYQWNKATGKLQAFGGAASGVALAEVAASTDLSGITLRVIAEGF